METFALRIQNVESPTLSCVNVCDGSSFNKKKTASLVYSQRNTIVEYDICTRLCDHIFVISGFDSGDETDQENDKIALHSWFGCFPWSDIRAIPELILPAKFSQSVACNESHKGFRSSSCKACSLNSGSISNARRKYSFADKPTKDRRSRPKLEPVSGAEATSPCLKLPVRVKSDRRCYGQLIVSSNARNFDILAFCATLPVSCDARQSLS